MLQVLLYEEAGKCRHSARHREESLQGQKYPAVIFDDRCARMETPKVAAKVAVGYRTTPEYDDLQLLPGKYA